MVLVQQTDADIIGHHQPVKAPLLTQHLGQQMVRSVAGFVVDIVIAGITEPALACLTAISNGNKKRVVQLAPTQMYWRMVAGAFAE